MTTWTLLLFVMAVPIVAAAIERARQRAGLSHKELAIYQGISIAQWSQQLHGQGHISLTRMSTTPPAFRAALLEELRAEWQLNAPTIADVYTLLLAIVRPRMARAGLDREQESRCTG